MTKSFLTALVVTFLLTQSYSDERESPPQSSPAPFWKAKSQVYKKIQEERYIAVSAKNEKAETKNKRLLTLITAGIIRSPVECTHQKIMEFDKYPRFMPYIQEMTYDKTTQNTFVHGALFGFHVKMTLHIIEESKPWGRQILWESIAGSFLGMKGVIKEETIGEETEISLDSTYLGEKIPIPDFIMNWGLEFASQRAAAAMRTHIEEECTKTPKKI